MQRKSLGEVVDGGDEAIKKRSGNVGGAFESNLEFGLAASDF